MSNNRPHIKNLKSNSLLNGEARKPEPNDLEFGEIAINYATDKETIFIKNFSNEIVEFKSSSQYESKLEEIRETISDDELVISSALNDLNDRILDEKSTRETADIEISQNLAREITNREGADNTLRNDLGSQISQLSSQIPIPDGTTIITDNEGKLKVKYHDGLTVGSNGVFVNRDTTKALDFDSNGTLGVRISDGIEFKEYDNNKKGISVKPKTNGGISVDSNGISINTGDGITVDETTGKLKVITGNTIEISTGGSIAVKQGDGVYTGSNGLAVKATSNGGLTVDSNGVSVNCGDGLATENGELVVKTPSNSGLTVDSNGLYLKTASTSEIGGVKVHGVYDSLSGYTYNEVISYFEEEDPEHIITVEEYEAITDPDKETLWGENTQNRDITVAEYEELSDKNKARCTEIRTPLVFDGENGNYGVKLDGDTDKAYVNVPAASSSTYGTIKVWNMPGVVPYDSVCPVLKDENGQAKIIVDTNYFKTVSGGTELSFNNDVSSLLNSLKSFYEVIIGIEVVSFDTSTGEIIVDTSDTVPVRKFTVYYNPNNLTNSQIIAGIYDGSVNVKVIMTFSGVSSSFIHKFPKIWESFFVLTNETNGEFCIFNPYCKSIDSTKNEPYVKITQLVASQDNKFIWQKIELVNHTDWVNI